MNQPGYVQLSTGKWPSGLSKSLEHLAMEPDEIAAELGIVFTPGEDDLGPFQEAGIRTHSGRLMLFLRYTKLPTPGTTVLIDDDDDHDEALEELRAVFNP